MLTQDTSERRSPIEDKNLDVNHRDFETPVQCAPFICIWGPAKMTTVVVLWSRAGLWISMWYWYMTTWQGGSRHLKMINDQRPLKTLPAAAGCWTQLVLALENLPAFCPWFRWLPAAEGSAPCCHVEPSPITTWVYVPSGICGAAKLEFNKDWIQNNPNLSCCIFVQKTNHWTPVTKKDAHNSHLRSDYNQIGTENRLHIRHPIIQTCCHAPLSPFICCKKNKLEKEITRQRKFFQLCNRSVTECCLESDLMR